MARWNHGLTTSCQNVENNQVGLEKTSNGGLTTNLNISQQANTSELKPIFIMKRKLFLKCNVAFPSTAIEAMVLSFDYFQVLSYCKDNSYTLDFFRQILWFFQPKNWEICIHLVWIWVIFLVFGKLLPNVWYHQIEKNFVPTSYHQDCTLITFIWIDKFSTKILTRITFKLGTQIRNITSILSGEGEQLPMILYLKHGLP